MKSSEKSGGREGIKCFPKHALKKTKKVLKIEPKIYIYYFFVAKHQQCFTPKGKNAANLKIPF